MSRDPRAAYDYCGKEESRVPDERVWELGSPPPARRNQAGDLAARNAQLIEKGALAAVTDGDIPLRDFCKVDAAIQEIRHRVATKPATLDKLDNFWIWGPPGTGKSRDMRREYPGLYDKMLNKWWNGYAGEETVLLDDLGPQHECLASHLKRWADHYPFPTESKGLANAPIRPKRILVTSNYRIHDVFKKTDADAIKRRFQEIHYPAALLEIDDTRSQK